MTLGSLVDASRSSVISRHAAVPLVVLAEAQLLVGAYADATVSLDEATALARSGGLTWVMGRIARVRAQLTKREGDPHKAEELVHEALTLGREAGDQMGVVDALELLAAAAEHDSPKEAVRLWAAADSMRNQLGYGLGIDRATQDGAIASARKKLPDFSTLWAGGAKLSAEEAIAYAARGRGERKRPTTGWASLTPSEVEVARLVSEHLSNPEIATRLFVSRATVKTHLLHIFSKLGIDSRSALAAEASKHC